MKIFAVVNPAHFPAVLEKPLFRCIAAVGTWEQIPCSKSDDVHYQLGAPLRVEWEPGAKSIGDFAWSGGYLFIASRRARSAFRAIGDQFRFERAISDVGRLKPTGPICRAIQEKRFQWPIPKKSVRIDPAVNGLVRKELCVKCGLSRYEFKLHDLKLDSTLIDEVDVFTIREIGQFSPVFVTDAYRKKLIADALDNISFILVSWPSPDPFDWKS